MSGCHIEAGRLFQILGSATEKLLLPSRVFVLGTVRTWHERSEAGGVQSPRSAGSRRPGTMELDLAATCRRELPACSRPTASLEASAGYEELVRCGRVGYSSRQKARPRILDRLQMPKQTVTDAVAAH